MIEEALDAILADHCQPTAIRVIECGGSPQDLWRVVQEAGFLDLLADGADAGLAPSDLFGVLACLGRHGMPLPMAQTIVVRALLDPGNSPPASALLTIAGALQRERGSGLRCRATPGGMLADWVLTCDGERLLLLEAAGAVRTPLGDARSGMADLSWAAEPASRPVRGAAGDLMPRAAAAIACQMAGAMQQVFELSLAYCNTRVQFGKPLGKFQAIQQQLSEMAEHVLAANLIARAGLGSDLAAPGRRLAAIAKARVSEASARVAATGHAVHGAIGMTDALELGFLTRRLHEWRIAYGAEHHWHEQLGCDLLASQQTMLDFCLSAD